MFGSKREGRKGEHAEKSERGGEKVRMGRREEGVWGRGGTKGEGGGRGGGRERERTRMCACACMRTHVCHLHFTCRKIR